MYKLHGKRVAWKMNCMKIHDIKQIAPPRTQALPSHDDGQRAGAPVRRAGKIDERSALRPEHARGQQHDRSLRTHLSQKVSAEVNSTFATDQGSY